MAKEIPENKLEKVNENKYRLTTKFPNVTRVDEFDKGFLKEQYEHGVKEMNQILDQLNKLNKDLKGVEYTKQEIDEIEDFVRINNKAREYEQYKKKKDQREAALDIMKRLREQKEDIEKVIPELKRRKK